MIKKNHTTFWVVATIGGISFATSVVFKFSNIANDFGYDISLGTFVGVVVALITVGTDIITTRKAAIQRMLLEVRHIKALHNELCYASTDAEIVRISTEIDKHFDFFQDAMCSIEWIVREDRNVKELFGEVYGYLANIVPILIASANQDPDKLEEAKKRSQCMREPNMNSIMKIWIPLVKKYDPKSLDGYINYDEWKNKCYKGHAYKTISEIIDETEKGKKENGQAEI